VRESKEGVGEGVGEGAGEGDTERETEIDGEKARARESWREKD